jgi:two-component system, OmpR family, sensor kinase
VTRFALALVTLFFLTLLVAAALLFGVVPDPIISFRIDVGLIVLIWALGCLAFGVLALLMWRSGERLGQQLGMAVEIHAAAERHRFLQRLDHELKNPLTAIRAALVNLIDIPHDLSERQALTTVESQSLRIKHLIGTLRKLAELEIHHIQRSPTNLTDVLNEVVLLAEENPARADRRIKLVIPQAPWPLPQVSGDYDLLILAIHNLVDNALKFSRPGDTIEVRAFEDGPMVAIEVADTGPGIAEEDIPHVWKDLYRGQSARSVPGSGLGLALVRVIADRHSGQVSLRSRVGQGTVVTLRLPTGTLPR